MDRPDADLGLRLDLLRGVRRALRRGSGCAAAGARGGPELPRELPRRGAPRGGERPSPRACSSPLPIPTGSASAGRGRRALLLRNGQGAVLEPQALAREEYLVAAELDGQPRESRIFLAAPSRSEEIETHFANDIVREDVLGWDDAARAVVGRRRRRLGALVLQEGPLPDPDPAAVTRAIMEGIRREGRRAAAVDRAGPAAPRAARLPARDRPGVAGRLRRGTDPGPG